MYNQYRIKWLSPIGTGLSLLTFTCDEVQKRCERLNRQYPKCLHLPYLETHVNIDEMWDPDDNIWTTIARLGIGD